MSQTLRLNLDDYIRICSNGQEYPLNSRGNPIQDRVQDLMQHIDVCKCKLEDVIFYKE